MKIAIEAGNVHLWAVFDHERMPTSAVDRLRSEFLSTDERRREATYLAAAARRQFVIARALLRTALSHCTGLDPMQLVISISESGKPALANQHAGNAAIEFNVSHTAGAIVLGVTRGRRIGVDVERVKTRAVTAQALSRFFDEDACATILAAPPGMQAAEFCKHWTLKEAYGKALGLTLPAALRSVRFALDDGRIAAYFAGAVSCQLQPQSQSQWQFQLYQPTCEHLLSLCVEACDAPATRCVVHHGMSAAESDGNWPLLLASSGVS